MATPDRGEDVDPEIPGGPDATGPPGADDDDREPWYAWGRWKYIGGALFLVLSVSGVSYVIWDIVDQMPKPVTMDIIRATSRVSPGRITDIAMLAGLISFGPPAGVDLMFGATKAATTWSRKVLAKEKAEGIAIGAAEERQANRERIRAILEANPDVPGLQELFDDLADSK